MTSTMGAILDAPRTRSVSMRAARAAAEVGQGDDVPILHAPVLVAFTLMDAQAAGAAAGQAHSSSTATNL